jgi:hypothetical protein
MSTKQKRMTEISRELTYLCAELEAMRERAVRVVEEVDNEFQDTPLLLKTKKMLATMRRLITKV